MDEGAEVPPENLVEDGGRDLRRLRAGHDGSQPDPGLRGRCYAGGSRRAAGFFSRRRVSAKERLDDLDVLWAELGRLRRLWLRRRYRSARSIRNPAAFTSPFRAASQNPRRITSSAGMSDGGRADQRPQSCSRAPCRRQHRCCAAVSLAAVRICRSAQAGTVSILAGGRSRSRSRPSARVSIVVRRCFICASWS